MHQVKLHTFSVPLLRVMLSSIFKNMKKILLAGFLFLFASFGNNLIAQSASGDKNNYTVAITKIKQLKPIFMAAESLAAEDGNSFGKFKVLICGKAVEELARPDTMAPYLEMAEKVDGKIIACEYSMKQLGVAPSSLTEGVESVENAILENLQLQKKGYLSLGL